MDRDSSFSGTDRVVLQKDYLASVDAALELYSDELEQQNSSLQIDSLQPSLVSRLARRLIPLALAWLFPVTCL